MGGQARRQGRGRRGEEAPPRHADRLTFERRGEGEAATRVFKLGTASLEPPAATFARMRPPRDPAFGLQAQGAVRLGALVLGWDEAENPAKARKLVERLVGRRWLERLGEVTPRLGTCVLRLDPARLTGVTTTGTWQAQGDALSGQGGALALLPWVEVGVLRFQLALDDGPGARIGLRSGTQSVAGWTLPQRVQADPARYRPVVVVFDLKAKVASAVVDGVRLRTLGSNPRDRLPTAKVTLALELMGRTGARVKDLELWQLGPRAAR